jgi:hypothetical protein
MTPLESGLLNQVKLSVSKTFDVHEQHVNVSAYANEKEIGFNISINHPSLGDVMNWKMISQKDVATVDCRIFGLSVSHCELDPKLPPCKDCPLNR